MCTSESGSPDLPIVRSEQASQRQRELASELADYYAKQAVGIPTDGAGLLKPSQSKETAVRCVMTLSLMCLCWTPASAALDVKTAPTADGGGIAQMTVDTADYRVNARLWIQPRPSRITTGPNAACCGR